MNESSRKNSVRAFKQRKFSFSKHAKRGVSYDKRSAYRKKHFSQESLNDGLVLEDGEFHRRCCSRMRITNHQRPVLKAKVRWGEEKKEDGEIKRDKNGVIIPSKKMKELRRKQFFNFISDFFEKIESGGLANKQNELIQFNDEEKEAWIKKYFKKYYMESLVLEDKEYKLKVDTDKAAKKRTCACTVGEYDQKTGKLVPPNELPNRKEKFIKVKMQPELATQDMIDA